MSKANLSTPAYAAACVADDKHQAARVKREAENEKQNRGNA